MTIYYDDSRTVVRTGAKSGDILVGVINHLKNKRSSNYLIKIKIQSNQDIGACHVMCPFEIIDIGNQWISQYLSKLDNKFFSSSKDLEQKLKKVGCDWNRRNLFQTNRIQVDDGDIRVIALGVIKNDIHDSIEKFLKSIKENNEQIQKHLEPARNGQGKFRELLLQLHGKCPFTNETNPDLLDACHIKEYAKCSSAMEKINPYNGLVLTPTMHRLFDKGFFTFGLDGACVFSDKFTKKMQARFCVQKACISVHVKSHSFLKWHHQQHGFSKLI